MNSFLPKSKQTYISRRHNLSFLKLTCLVRNLDLDQDLCYITNHKSFFGVMVNLPRIQEIHVLLVGEDQAQHNLRFLGMKEPINVETIYVEAKLQECDTISPSGGMLNAEKILGLDAVRKYPKIMVHGKPGSGKSTFLRHIFCSNICSEIDHLPILVPLKDFSHALRKSQCKELDEYIISRIERKGIDVADIKEIFKNGHALFILDGVDEMAVSDRSQVMKFLCSHKHNRFIVSSRNAAAPIRLNELDFIEVQIADFDPEQANEFIDNFCREMTPSNRYHEQDEDFAICIDKIRHLIKQREYNRASERTPRWKNKSDRWIEEFSKTPLLLTMLIPLVLKENEIPSSRLELYDKSVNNMLTEWDNFRGVSRRFPSGFTTIEERKMFLSDVALKAHEDNLPKISKTYIKTILDNKFNDDQILKDALQSIEESSGILIEDRDDEHHYIFRHKTFQEYFASLNIARSIRGSDLNTHISKERIGDTLWLEVFSLVAESLCKDNFDQELIDSFLLMITEGIRDILRDNYALNKFLKRVNRKVKNLLNKHPIPETREFSMISVALRIFFFDPDYRLDPTRALLLEFDRSFGNVLVAASFIIRLFCDDDGNDIEIIEAIETVKQEPKILRAIDADHALKLIHEYAKACNYTIKRILPKQGQLQLREEAIKKDLHEIYDGDTSNMEKQAKKCRALCHNYLRLGDKYGLRLRSIRKNLPDHDKTLDNFYTSTLLLARTITIMSQASQTRLNHNITSLIMKPIELWN